MNFAPPPTDLEQARRAAAAALEWYLSAGVDTIFQNTPRDRFAETQAEMAARRRSFDAPIAEVNRATPAPASIAHAPSPSAAPPTPPADPLHPPAMDDEAAIADARERAKAARTLEELAETLAAFTGCGLKHTARSLVFADGAPDADLMLVGEAPGREEDAAGLPFVGRSGQLLNRMLAAIGLERAAVRVTNTVPWRPPGNRTPTPGETEMCLPFLMRHIELVRPKVLVCLGSPASRAILRSNEGILRLRGRWSDLELAGGALHLPVTATLHPAYLLRQPAQKRLAWRDLLAVKARLEG